MNLSIKALFISLGIFGVILSIGFVVNLNELDENSDKLKNFERNRFLMIQKADELRQTSDDLTRFVRTYAVTLNKEYKNNYFSILDIRNGISPKPKYYDRIYWDFSEPRRSQKHPLGEASALKDEISNLPYTDKELEYLQKSEEQSNHLVAIEIEAFNALKGLYKDKNGKYTVAGERNQSLAISLLHSETYHKEKEDIMFLIDAFLDAINERTKRNIDTYTQKVELSENNLFRIVLSAILIFAISAVLILIKVLIPIKRLTKAIRKYQNGETDFKLDNHADDEIGLMSQQFCSMRETLDEKYFQMKEMTITDELTHVYNRKFYNEKVLELLSLYKRYETVFSMIIFDIDNFKHINDTYGHQMGDKVLIEMSTLVQSLIRDTDYLFRVGGEEFIVLLCETSLEPSKQVAEKIRKSVSGLKTLEPEVITISLGLTEVMVDDTEDNLFKRADDLLYHSKKNGKNRVSS